MHNPIAEIRYLTTAIALIIQYLQLFQILNARAMTLGIDQANVSYSKRKL